MFLQQNTKDIVPSKSCGFGFIVQGVVTLIWTVEPSATGIKIFDRRKFTLIS